MISDALKRLVLTILVSVLGTFIPAKHCARIFKDQKIPGSIVMIASMSGQIANRVSPSTGARRNNDDD